MLHTCDKGELCGGDRGAIGQQKCPGRRSIWPFELRPMRWLIEPDSACSDREGEKTESPHPRRVDDRRLDPVLREVATPKIIVSSEKPAAEAKEDAERVARLATLLSGEEP